MSDSNCCFFASRSLTYPASLSLSSRNSLLLSVTTFRVSTCVCVCVYVCACGWVGGWETLRLIKNTIHPLLLNKRNSDLSKDLVMLGGRLAM